jgi:prevent-host-death family protein
MAMKTVSVAGLKSKLSQYLNAVKNGKEIVVTSHGHSVARIVPIEKSAEDLEIIPAKKPVSSLKKIKGVRVDVDLVADLIADRRRR